MALFKSKNKIEEERRKEEERKNQIYQKLSQLDILEDIIENLKNGPEWRYSCQGYYDTRKRRVCIDEDLFTIEWLDEKIVSSDPDKFIERNAYRYTSSGYRPLVNYECLEIWAEVVRERMMALWPECNFTSVWKGTCIYGTKCRFHFEYTVPNRTWKEWI